MFKTLNNEKGIALVIALMVLAAVTMMGIAAILTSTLDMQIAGNERTGIQAQYAAEAGLAESIARLNLGTGDAKYMGTPTTPSPWPAVWANNPNATYKGWGKGFKGEIKSTDNKVLFNYTVAVRLKEHKNGGNWVAFYNRTSGFTKSPYITGGSPVYYVESTGSSGNYRSKVVLEVTKDIYDYKVNGGFTANGNITLKGSSLIDGTQHTETGAPGGSCTFSNLTGSQPGISTEGSTVTNVGNKSTVTPAAQTGVAYAPQAPWDVLGLSQSQFDSIFTNVQPLSYAGARSGELYLKGVGTYNPTSLAGSGILVVHNPAFVPGECVKGVWDGACDTGETSPCNRCATSKAPAKLDANTGTFKGLIIADQVWLRGNVSIIGAVVSLTSAETEATGAGNPTVLYSCEAIEKYAGGKVKRKLAWTVKR
jgi:Tfp pilus assembly protein PilX